MNHAFDDGFRDRRRWPWVTIGGADSGRETKMSHPYQEPDSAHAVFEEAGVAFDPTT
jgi:hypothetical protein